MRSGPKVRSWVCVKWPLIGKPIKPFADKGQEAVAAGGVGALIDHRLVDEVGIKEGVGDRRAAFHQHARDAAPGELIRAPP